MPLAPGLLIRSLVRPGGRVVTVITRRRPVASGSARASAPPNRPTEPVQEKPYRMALVPTCDMVVTKGFSRPVACALAALGPRAAAMGRDGVALDGRRVSLIRMVAEANRCLAAAGRQPIRYPGLRMLERRR